MMKRFLRRILYATGLGTLLQRREWDRQHSLKYQIKKIKKGLRSGDQNRSMLFDRNYSTKAWAAKTGYEYFYCDPDRNDAIIRYFTKRGYIVEESKFGKNLFIYK